MTVTAQTPIATFTANGVTTVFPYAFLVRQDTDMVVEVSDPSGNTSTKTLGVDYTITGAGSGTGGTVIFTVAPINLYTVSVYRSTALIRSTNYPNNGDLPAGTLNLDFDALWLALQELFSGRGTLSSLRAPAGESINRLPAAAGRVGKFLTFDSSGQPLLSSGTGVDAGLRTDLSAASGSTLVRFLPAPVGAVARTVQSKLREFFSLWDFDPHADGATSDASALTNANLSGNEFTIPAGNYMVASNVTFGVPVRMAFGAKLIIPTGVTVTFSGGFEAPLHQVFACSGTGKVVFGGASLQIGYPEWWGAVVGGADCLAAINACIVACPVTQLQQGDYWSSGTILMQTAFRVFRGTGKSWTAAGGTRIICTSASADIILRGPNSNPGSINGHLQHTYVQDMTLQRSGAPTISSNCAGIRSQFLLFGGVSSVDSIESMHGFWLGGVVQDHYRECYAWRTLAGAGAGSDYAHGYYLYGQSGITAAGGSASVYFTDCTAACSLTLAGGNIGFALDTAGADTFLLRPEVTSCTQGIVVVGSGSLSAGYQVSGDADIHIVDPILDAIGTHGILLSNLASYAAVSIEGGYAAPAAGASFIGIHVLNSGGCVHVKNGFQVVGWPSGSSTGVRIENSSGVDASPILSGCRKPMELIGAQACRVAPTINNPGESCTQGAVDVSSSTNRCYIAPIVKGGASRFSYGVNLNGSTNTNNEINCTGMVITALSSGAANKLYINGASITTTGLSGSNLVSGVMT